MMATFKNKWIWLLLSVLVIIVDQVTKHIVTMQLEPYHPIAILPMLNFTLAYNTGAAFNFLSGAGAWHHWFFASFSTIISLAIMIWLYRMPKDAERLQYIALSLILGGALANLIDRLTLGYVIDFIQVYYKHFYWPIFNIADSAISIGTFLLTIDLFKHSKSSDNRAGCCLKENGDIQTK